MGNTPIRGPHSGPKEALIQFALDQGAKRMDQVHAFLNTLYAQSTFDAFMVGVQSALETNNWRSSYWNERLNPGAIGITGPPDGTVGWDQGISYETGIDAAKAMLIHHCAYTGTPVPIEWSSWLPLDPRYDAVINAGYAGSVRTWSDYGNGRWATDTQYYQKLMTRESAVRAFVSASEDNSMATPRIIDKWLHVAQDGYAAVNRRYIGRFGMAPKIIVLHIQEGINIGSWQHFHVVTASSTVLIGKNGDIWRLVPEADSPWTNGDVQSPSPLGWEIMNKYGPDPNVYSLTIETEGYTGEWPKPEAQIDAVVWQIDQWMKRYGIPLRYVIRHAEINSVSRAFCPGNAFYNEVIKRLQALATPTTPEYAKPTPVVVQGVNWDGSQNVNVNGALFIADKKTVKSISDGVRVRQKATTKAAETRKPLTEGEGFGVLGWCRGEAVNGEDRWWLTKSYSRINVNGTVEKPTETAPPEDDAPDVPEGVRVVNGVAYYPAQDGDKPREVVITTTKANIRNGPSTKAKAVGVVKKGETYTVAYWCFGTAVNDESVWWVLAKDTDGQDALENPRMIWAAATNSRPE